MPLDVLGAGFGRTGTTSLKHALEILGYGPCYHMETVFFRPFHAHRWARACAGRLPDWERLLRGHRAAVDWPACTFYATLMEHYPQAKVILTVRDPDRWYASVAATLFPVMQRFPLNRWGRWLPHAGAMGHMLDCLVWEGTFGGRFADREHALAVFERHNREVVANVPSDHLLIFDVRQGWEPLCRFLDAPVPAVPFPHSNDRDHYWRRVRWLTGALALGLGAGAGLTGFGLWRFLRHRQSQRNA